MTASEGSQHVVPDLPELPDLEEMKALAYQRRDHFARIAAEAQAEVEKAQRIIAQLTGRSLTLESGARKTVSDATYTLVLSKLADHSRAGIHTLGSEASVSRSHISTVMRLAVERGHAEREKRGRRFRFIITSAGVEFLTAPEAGLTRAAS